MIRVMITGYARHSKSIADAFRYNRAHDDVYILGVNSDATKLSRSGADATCIVSPVTSDEYLPVMLDVCRRYDIQIILPFITVELPVISRLKDKFAESGIKVSIVSPDALDILNNKIKLYDMFINYMPEQIVPKSISEATAFIDAHGNGNVCCKLSDKCGGAGFAIIDDDKALDLSLLNRYGVSRFITARFFLQTLEKAIADGNFVILQKYERGSDYTVCALADNGNPVSMCGYIGYEIDYGCITRGKIAEIKQAYDIFGEVIRKTNLDGNACADFIVTPDGGVKLLEINPRLNGSLAFCAAAGANYIYDRVKLLLDSEYRPEYDISYGLEMVKYYENQYF